ncbi:MAG: MerR family transcriptional regulator [Clostridiales bacterium]|nr:MerR family transcriptional regulator [Clostridiales bacterium]
MKISEVAKMTGVTVRTLHYYDEIGLLKPSQLSENGYRDYDDGCLEKLKQILFFRELDFSLKDIATIMQSPSYDPMDALKRQKSWLGQERDRLERLIQLAEMTIRGEIGMDFQAFDKSELLDQSKQYASEAKERWGNSEAYQQSQRKTVNYNEQKRTELKGEMDELIERFAQNRHVAPQSELAQGLVESWKQHISKSYYECTNEILLGLGEMYTADERFTKNMDKYGEGTAAFMNAAIKVYCTK